MLGKKNDFLERGGGKKNGEWGGCVLRLVFIRSLKLSTHYTNLRNWMGDHSVNESV